MTPSGHVLLTNDDGFDAPGIAALAEAAARVFARVSVVAPEREQSAMSHALTIRRALRARPRGAGRWSLDGTPTDCVNVALYQLLDAPPDAVLSGVNAGYNLGDDLTYSGTVAGALEARLLGVPSFAFSAGWEAGPEEFAEAAVIAVSLASQALREGLPLDAFLNVNIPKHPRGVRAARQGRRAAPVALGRNGAEGEGLFEVALNDAWRPEPGADHAAVAEGYVSVTPLHADLTFHRALPVVEGWALRLEGDR